MRVLFAVAVVALTKTLSPRAPRSQLGFPLPPECEGGRELAWLEKRGGGAADGRGVVGQSPDWSVRERCLGVGVPYFSGSFFVISYMHV